MFYVNFLLISLFHLSLSFNWTNYANFILKMTDYANGRCIFIIAKNYEQDKLLTQNILKEIASRITVTANFYSFEKYLYIYENMYKRRCSVPIQVILNENDQKEFEEHSRSRAMHGPDYYGEGVWIIFLKSLADSYLLEFFKKFNLPFDVQLIAAQFNSGDQESMTKNLQVLMKEVYRVSPDLPLRITSLGTWSPDNSLQIPNRYLVYSRRNNLEGITLKIAYLISPPYVELLEEDDKTVIGGYFGAIWKTLERMANVSSNITELDINGAYDPTSKIWTGFLGSLSRGEFDIGISEMAMSPDRKKIVDFSFPLKTSGFHVYVQTPGSMIEAEIIFYPLGTDIWISLIIWAVVAPVLVYFASVLSDRFLHTNENVKPSSAMLTVFGALCSQGSSRVPVAHACRILFLTSFLINAVTLPSYSASLTSYLAVIPALIPFKSWREFYERGAYKMTVLWNSYEYDVFANGSPNDKYIKLIFDRDILLAPRTQFPKSTEIAIENVCRDKQVAYFSLTQTVDWAIANKIRKENDHSNCTITRAPTDIGKISLCMTFPRNSHYRGLINHCLMQMYTAGVMDRLDSIHWMIAKHLSTGADELKPVEIRSIFMILALLIAGYIISIIFLIIEIVVWKKNRERPLIFHPSRSLQDLNKLKIKY